MTGVLWPLRQRDGFETVFAATQADCRNRYPLCRFLFILGMYLRAVSSPSHGEAEHLAKNLCSGSKSMMNAFSRAGSPALGWGVSPRRRQPARTAGERRPRPPRPGAPRQHWELLRPPGPCRRMGYLSVNAPLQRHQKLCEMDGEASRCNQGRWLLRVPGLGLRIPTPQLCLCFFGSLAVYLAKWWDSPYPTWELSSLKALLSCS